jgi:hypothetical protein
LPELKNHLENWLRGQSFNLQDLKTEEGATLIQIQQQGGWRKLVGMEVALNIVLHQHEEELTVEIGAGRWYDKVSVGVVSLFGLWPLAITTAIGVWSQQKKMPERIFGQVDHFLASRQVRSASTGSLTPEMIGQLRDLAALRDQGILTEEEFQAEKSRLLGR